MAALSGALSPSYLDRVADRLANCGWAVMPDAVDRALVEALVAVLERYEAGAMLARAGVGRSGDHTVSRAVRGDRIRWLGRTTEAERAFLDRLRSTLNRIVFSKC